MGRTAAVVGRARWVLALVAVFAASCGDEYGFALEMTVTIDNGVDDATLARVTSLVFSDTGDETFTHASVLSRSAKRTERLVYHPSKRARAIKATVSAEDEHGVVIATSVPLAIDLPPGKTTHVTLTLVGTQASSDGGGLTDGAGGDKYEATILKDHPLAYFRCDETGGTTAHDVTGNNNNGTYFGTYTLGNAGALVGDADTAMTSTGAPAGIEVGKSFLNVEGVAAWSVEMWVNPTALPTTTSPTSAYLFSLGSDVNWIHAFITPTHIQLERTDTDKTSPNVGIDGTVPKIGVFTHFVATYDGKTLTIYEQGLSNNSIGATASADALDVAFFIGDGSESDTEAFAGSIDEVAIYDYALSPAQVTNHYGVGTGP